MKTYLTEYKKDGKTYGDSVQAETWEKAKLEIMHKDEIIIGELVSEQPLFGAVH
jgi:hypothetical protein